MVATWSFTISSLCDAASDPRSLHTYSEVIGRLRRTVGPWLTDYLRSRSSHGLNHTLESRRGSRYTLSSYSSCIKPS